MLEDEFETEQWQIELYYQIENAFIKKDIDKNNLRSNGYYYELEYNNLKIDFCIQTLGYNGGARFVGEAYNTNVQSEEQKSEMKNNLESKEIKGSENQYLDLIRYYNYRDICIYGNDAQTLITKLITTVEMPIEEYIRKIF